jgi:hypothetical protein
MRLIIRGLTFIHRWLGLAFCLVFLAWFASGIVLVYHRMPEYSTDERLARLAPLELEDVRISPKEAYDAAGLTEMPQRAYISSYRDRAVFRFLARRGWVSVYADNGAPFVPLDPEDAVGVAGDLFPAHRSTAQHVRTIDEPDQWTIGHPFRATGPLHVVSLGDAAATEVYIARSHGELMLKTDRASRFWGYVGPVLHWFYFRPFRVQTAWYNTIVYGSMVGLFICLLGLFIGVYRMRILRRRAAGADRKLPISPYAGWLKWHHYAGLTFGVVTFTFLFSGMLSMVPYNWSPGNGPDPTQALLIRGSTLRLDFFGLYPSDALRQFQGEFRPSELELRQFLGAPFYIAYEPPADADAVNPVVSTYGSTGATLRSLLVAASGEVTQTGELFNDTELLEAAQAVMPDFGVTEAAWLTEYDNYYYGKGGDRRLPVLRVTFNDPDETSLYLDAHDGQLVQREVRRTRVERWVYHGLHSLDFPWVYQRWWAWYPLILILSVGGLALSLSSVVVAIRYVKNLFRRREPATTPV